MLQQKPLMVILRKSEHKRIRTESLPDIAQRHFRGQRAIDPQDNLVHPDTTPDNLVGQADLPI
jgi:hypothetical protein